MDAWKTIEAWLGENAPEVAKTLNPPASDDALTGIEQALKITLTDAERAYFKQHDGQDTFGPPIAGDWLLLPAAAIPKEWQTTLPAGQDAAADATVKPGKGVAKRWFHEAWMPWATDGGGNFLCVDHAPAEGGTEGQIVRFSSGDEQRPVVAAGIDAWLAELSADMAAGHYAWRDGQVAKA